MPEDRYEPQRRYHAKTICRVTVDLNRNTESDLVERVESQPNKSGYIKGLIRADVERTKNGSE